MDDVDLEIIRDLGGAAPYTFLSQDGFCLHVHSRLPLAPFISPTFRSRHPSNFYVRHMIGRRSSIVAYLRSTIYLRPPSHLGGKVYFIGALLHHPTRLSLRSWSGIQKVFMKADRDTLFSGNKKGS